MVQETSRAHRADQQEHFGRGFRNRRRIYPRTSVTRYRIEHKRCARYSGRRSRAQDRKVKRCAAFQKRIVRAVSSEGRICSRVSPARIGSVTGGSDNGVFRCFRSIENLKNQRAAGRS